jgi:hypothetical protein
VVFTLVVASLRLRPSPRMPSPPQNDDPRQPGRWLGQTGRQLAAAQKRQARLIRPVRTKAAPAAPWSCPVRECGKGIECYDDRWHGDGQWHLSQRFSVNLSMVTPAAPTNSMK